MTTSDAARDAAPANRESRGHRGPWVVALLDVVAYGVAVAMSSVDVIFEVLAGAAIASLAITGALLMDRARGNRVGLLLLAAATLLATATVLGTYAVANAGATGAGAIPTAMASVLNDILFVYPMVVLLIGIPLIFPDGHLLGPRWRAIVWLTVSAMAALTISKLFTPGPVGAAAIENPLGAAGLEPILQALALYASLTAPIGFGAAALAVAIRFRRSRGIEREQLKWFLAVVGICATAFTAVVLLGSGALADAAFLVAFAGLIAMPVAIGIAILRYRLYDIDRLVSRSIAYALVTGGLIVVYATVNLGLTTMFGSLTRAEPVAVAASTLVVAALFTPVRRRVQAIVDQRFDRGRYDAERTTIAFAARLRNEVDLLAVTADLDATVRAAVAPADMAMWLRAGSAR